MAALLPSSLFQAQANLGINQQTKTDDLELPSHLNLDDIFTNIAPMQMNYRMSLQNAYNSAIATQQYPMTMNSMNAIGSHFVPVTPPQSVDNFGPSDLEPKPLSEMLSFAPARVSPSVPTNNFLPSYPAPIIQFSQINPNKRSFGALEVPEESAPQFNRRERNREHAKQSRIRKKSVTDQLEQAMADLKEENEKLRERVYEKIGRKETDSAVELRMRSPAEKCIVALKNPQNKVVDEDTLLFLKDFSKKIIAKEDHHLAVG